MHMSEYNLELPIDLPDEIIELIPETPPSGPRETLYLYGVLYRAYLMDRYDVSLKESLYVTPGEVDDIRGEPETVVSVDIDVTNGSATYDGVTIGAYNEDMVKELIHSWYDASRGMDHSVTHKTGTSTKPETVAKYAVKRITDWCGDETVLGVASKHQNGGLITSVAELSEDEALLERIREDVEQRISGSKTRLVTIRLNTGTGFEYPGQFGVFTDAMEAVKETKLYEKNSATDARGNGVCFVTDDEETMYGVSSDPSQWFKTKQQEVFPDLDSDESWRALPLSEKAALTSEKGEKFLDACRYTSSGASIFLLPFLSGEKSRGKIELLYHTLVTQLLSVQKQERSEDDSGHSEDESTRRTPDHIERMYEEYSNEYDDLIQFHLIGVEKQQASVWRVLFTEFGVSGMRVVELAEMHSETINRIKTASEIPYPVSDKQFFADEAQPSLIGSPLYFMETVQSVNDSAEPSVDHPAFRFHRDLLSNQPISFESLLQTYMKRVIEEWDPSSDGDTVPTWEITKQYTQLMTLLNAGSLRRENQAFTMGGGNNEHVETSSHNHMTTNTSQKDADTDKTPENSRETLYTDFIQSHQLLQDNHEREAAFVFGALVGELSRVQSKGKNINNTLTKTHTAKKIQKHSLPQMINEVLEKAITYSKTSDTNMNGVMFSELTTRLTDTLQQTNPENWELSIADIRMHYSLGVVYGQNRR